jgi:hypothetical protein
LPPKQARCYNRCDDGETDAVKPAAFKYAPGGP